jgi:5-methylcytosine-specific restriction endonuclease McrA
MIHGDVLVLNTSFQVVQTTSLKRALVLLFSGRVKAVDEQYRTYDWEQWSDVPVQAEDDYISTPHRKIAVPSVIQLLYYDRTPRRQMKFSRGNIFIRDKNKCQYCRKQFHTADLSLDHVIPQSRGGKSTWENVVCSCLDCNVRKADRTPEEAGMKLLRHPVRPTWNPVYRLAHRRMPKTWKNFLDEAYWSVELTD